MEIGPASRSESGRVARLRLDGVARRIRRADGDAQGVVWEVGRGANAVDVPYRYGLQPHGLPDPRVGGVPDAAGAQPLLANGLAAPVDGRIHTDHHLLDAGAAQGRGDVHAERVIAAPVGPDPPAVHPHRRLPVDRAEVE